ncbi:TcpQ domain-containing protein [Reinekea sp. G2M2-21]|uniref:TcpQ domain-containing protein n=1 Tax=Reinekea sp. G2M2-21 TaxID=2788942 RepID=UPI0018AB621D|nr:TcpQ domain-containing protein [Reinekea sp. G2M2-21]
MSNEIRNSLLYANVLSKVYGMYVIVIAPALLGLVVSFALLRPLVPLLILAITVEVVRAMTRKSYTDWWSIMLFKLFKDSYTSYPTKYKPRVTDLLPMVLATFVLYTALSEQAMADYRLIDSGSYDRAILEGSLGTASNDLVAGSCDQCPLNMALDMILPDDLLVSWAENVKKDQTIRFSGPKQWAYILKDIALEHDLIFILRVRDSMGRNSLSVSRAPVNAGALIYETPRQPEILTAKTKRWTLTPGQRLPVALRAWAQTEGKKIAWELEREPVIEYEAVFQGNLLDAMEQVIAAYQAQGLMREAIIQPSSNGVFVFKSSKKGEF